MANGALAAFMMGNAKEIFCNSNPGHAQLFVCVAMVGQLKGLGLDIPATYVDNPRLRLGTAQDSFLGTGWIVVQPIGRRRPALETA